MHYTIKNLNNINEQIKSTTIKFKVNKVPQVIAVSKTFKLESILPLIEYGHSHFGENKVQEALEKWSEIKTKKNNLNLHLIGRLQTNKVKYAVKIFDYIHSVDSEKLAKKISEEQVKQNRSIKLFIQVNVGNEEQKSGISVDALLDLYNYCTQLGLNIIGTMCIPPMNQNAETSFKITNNLNLKLGLKDLSMGMSSDYIQAIKNGSTYVRIGSNIFGPRD